uniref:Uncharacterized protein n=1 Tax=Peronospora matthiolae TaxID=2874970 RepID=A0AAV1UKI8_9STRA
MDTLKGGVAYEQGGHDTEQPRRTSTTAVIANRIELSGSKRRDQLKFFKSDDRVTHGRTRRRGTLRRQSGHACLTNDVTAVLLSTDVRDKDGFCMDASSPS